MAINYFCKDSDESRIMHSKSDSIEIMVDSESYEINEEPVRGYAITAALNIEQIKSDPEINTVGKK